MSLIECLTYIHRTLPKDHQVWEHYEGTLLGDETFIDKWPIDFDTDTITVDNHVLTFGEEKVFIVPSLTVPELEELLGVTQDINFVRYCYWYPGYKVSTEYDINHLVKLHSLNIFDPMATISYHLSEEYSLSNTWLSCQLKQCDKPVQLIKDLLDHDLLLHNDKCMDENFTVYILDSRVSFDTQIKQSSYDNVMIIIYFIFKEIGRQYGQQISDLFRIHDMRYSYLHSRLDLISHVYGVNSAMSLTELTKQVNSTPTRDQHVKEMAKREAYAEIYLEQHLIPDIVKNIMRYL